MDAALREGVGRDRARPAGHPAQRGARGGGDRALEGADVVALQISSRANVVHVSRDAGLRAEFDEEGVLASFGPARLMIHRWLRDEPGERLLLRSDEPDLDEQLVMIAKEL